MVQETHGLVYSRLYDTPLPDRLNRAWCTQLRCQLMAMRKALSFMLTPCVEHIMSFLELDDELVHVCLLLRQQRSDLGTPTIRNLHIPGALHPVVRGVCVTKAVYLASGSS